MSVSTLNGISGTPICLLSPPNSSLPGYMFWLPGMWLVPLVVRWLYAAISRDAMYPLMQILQLLEITRSPLFMRYLLATLYPSLAMETASPKYIINHPRFVSEQKAAGFVRLLMEVISDQNRQNRRLRARIRRLRKHGK